MNIEFHNEIRYLLIFSRGNALAKTYPKRCRFKDSLYRHSILFYRKIDLCGKVYSTKDKRAADCMGNVNEKSTILLVDDNETVLGVGSLMIQKIGYKVLRATTGMEAVQIFQDNVNEICLVILDEKLPDELGTDTCKRLKGFEPDVKVLHTSGLGKIQDVDRFDCGCEAFLHKPFRVEEFSNKLQEILANTQA